MCKEMLGECQCNLPPESHFRQGKLDPYRPARPAKPSQINKGMHQMPHRECRVVSSLGRAPPRKAGGARPRLDTTLRPLITSIYDRTSNVGAIGIVLSFSRFSLVRSG